MSDLKLYTLAILKTPNFWEEVAPARQAAFAPNPENVAHVLRLHAKSLDDAWIKGQHLKGVRSLSVGDVVIAPEGAYMPSRTGWLKLEREL